MIIISSPRQIEDYIKETSGGEEEASPTKWDILKGDARFKVHLFLPKLNQIIWNSNVIGSILTALNSFQPVKRKEQHDLLLWSSDLCIKTANSCGEFPLHQVLMPLARQRLLIDRLFERFFEGSLAQSFRHPSF